MRKGSLGAAKVISGRSGCVDVRYMRRAPMHLQRRLLSKPARHHPGLRSGVCDPGSDYWALGSGVRPIPRRELLKRV